MAKCATYALIRRLPFSPELHPNLQWTFSHSETPHRWQPFAVLALSQTSLTQLTSQRWTHPPGFFILLFLFSFWRDLQAALVFFFPAVCFICCMNCVSPEISLSINAPDIAVTPASLSHFQTQIKPHNTTCITAAQINNLLSKWCGTSEQMNHLYSCDVLMFAFGSGWSVNRDLSGHTRAVLGELL